MTAPWVIVLAGGEGRRLGPSIARWLGVRRPKQFCSIIGSRSMVQHALDRAAEVTTPERIVTVIGPEQRAMLDQTVRPGAAGTIIEQPYDRGTAAAVLMSLVHVVQREPEATLLVLPAAQFAYPELRFVRYLERACAAAAEKEDSIVLLGAVPRYPESDLGWVVPGERVGDLAHVTWLRQTPLHAGATALLRNGGLWNTQIFAARGMTLWRISQRFAPGLLEGFAAIVLGSERWRREPMAPGEQERLLAYIYADLPQAELTSTLLLRAHERLLVLRMDEVLWADWSRPDWVIEALGHLDHGPLGPEDDAHAGTARMPGLGRVAG